MQNKKPMENKKTVEIKVMAKERPWLSLTPGSIRAMLTLCEARNSRYWSAKQIEKWAVNRDLWSSVEQELAARN